MHQSSEISENLRKLFERGQESSDALEELTRIAASDGLSEPELNMVLDIIFDYSLRNSLRSSLITKCLVPDGDFLIQPEVISRVLGAVGVSEVYFRNGKQFKSKRLPPTSQNLLLEWLICASHFFGKALFDELHKLLPMLFGLLSFEYSRSNITVLIVIGLSQQRKSRDALTGSKRYALKPWHVNMVVNLSLKFPFDPCIKSLIAYMKRLNPTLDFRGAPETRNLDSSKSDVIQYPNKDLKSLLTSKISNSSSCSWETNEVRDKVQRLFDSFSGLSFKKRKMVIRSFNDLDLLDSPSNVESISIGTVESLRTLVDEFDKISMANPGSLFTLNNIANERLRKYFLAFNLSLSHDDSPLVKKFIQAVKFHALSSESSTSAFSQLVSIASTGDFPQLSQPLESAITSTGISTDRKVRLLRFLHPDIETFRVVIEEVSKPDTDSHWNLLYQVLSKTFIKWFILHSEYGFFQDVYPTILNIVKDVFLHTESRWQRFNLLTKLKFMEFLRSLRQLAFNDAVDGEEPSALVPGPTLFYQMILSSNPFILSEALGYISFLRTLKFEEGGTALKLRNSLIMDSINFVWLDQAFKFDEGTFNKGMYLDAEYLKKVAGLNFFTYSDLIELKNMGGLSHSPGTSYLVAEIIWSLEDEENEISVRHPGPLSEDSVAMLQQNSDVRWLRKSYFEIKVDLLNRLDSLGYTGLCDLLFSSLRPLADLRQKKVTSTTEAA
ncbi:hypothetical protein FT663_02252 [Candidozyma haemuli var. vulneris]|uniref:Uncharacterized protein n=1 Tax=Candidozyma haemuli TaxID=45357 RepID=A0A2V1ATS5_9ASCO|nr:hypothetical protein CXQ85_000207 [[Candida] haemuloni]KAF3992599.1 hypothetical protein FT663_02252 [[Candida] haemuloni var. vulneris]KAF3992651.1 hypothetical protein FT662_01032 [[Candida] haemuloni var. vulneris]PVH21238.1 hypothetical protein CXQ85_000207 [[Candida] haemuloni]